VSVEDWMKMLSNILESTILQESSNSLYSWIKEYSSDRLGSSAIFEF
jgi:hypothetical protein